MSDQVKAIKSLEIDNVKIYESKGDKLSLLTKGKLEILYFPEFDRFVLRLDNFKYILSSKLPIVASLSQEEDFRSYTVPNIGGHYILKLESAHCPTLTKNLETIFTNYSQFSYQQTHEHDLENQAHRRSDQLALHRPLEIARHHSAPNHPEALAKANRYIKAGGEMLKQNLIKAASYIGKNIGHAKSKSISFQDPNQLYVRTIDELKGSDNSANQISDFPKYEMTALMTLLEEHEKIISHQSYQDIGVKMHPSSENKWPTFKKAAIESAQSLLKGMDDAAGDLAKALKTKKTPQDKEERVFKKIDQNINGQAPLPIHKTAPDQQQASCNTEAKASGFSQLQGLSTKVRSYFA